MPELPDVELYVERLRERLTGTRLEKATFLSPFVLRTTTAIQLTGLVVGVSRLGKRIVIELAEERFILIHLMIAGRLRWEQAPPSATPRGGRSHLAVFRFTSGQLSLVENSTRKRASIHLLEGRVDLESQRRSGLDVFAIDPETFHERVHANNRTLKRFLTDPNTLDGIGNAYSDEILFAARLSPVRLTRSLERAESSRLLDASRTTLAEWTRRLRERYPDFPKPSDITAFRRDFSVHGRFGQPCPVCASPIQRILYADHETNYCAVCQNEGKLLADRSLSRLLKDDWPKTLEEMTEEG